MPNPLDSPACAANQRLRFFRQRAHSFWVRCAAAAILVLVWLSPAAADRGGEERPEYHVKAAFMYNFCKFIQWPDDAFEDENSPIILAVTDATPFGRALEALDGRRVGQRTLEIREYSKPAEIGRCHMLFIPKTDRARTDAYLEQVTGTPVVTVGETPEFLAAGGMMRFVQRASKLRFHINPTAMREAALTVSSQLLKLAEQLHTNERREPL